MFSFILKPLVESFSDIMKNISNNERLKMVIVVREDLKMSRGKIAAQVAHGGKIFTLFELKIIKSFGLL